MSYENRGKTISLIASAAYAKRYFAVKKDSVDEQFVVCSAGDVPVGILQDPTPKNAAGAVMIEGVSFVEANGVIAAGASVTTAADGLATTALSETIPFGVALNGAAAKGDIISVLLKPVGNPATNSIVLGYTSTDLDAGADITNALIGASPFAGTLVAAKVIATGTAAGIDDDNTSKFDIKVGDTVVATKTYNTSVAFPASGEADDLIISDGAVSAADILTLSVTNGSTANLSTFIVQLFIV